MALIIGIQRKLAMRDDEMPDARRYLSAAPPPKDKTREKLVSLQQKAQSELKRYEDALRIATTVLGERRQ